MHFNMSTRNPAGFQACITKPLGGGWDDGWGGGLFSGFFEQLSAWNSMSARGMGAANVVGLYALSSSKILALAFVSQNNSCSWKLYSHK